MKKYLVMLALFLTVKTGFALTTLQQKAVVVSKAELMRLKKIKPDSSNANTVNNLLGQPAACMPVGLGLGEVWMCQWKGDIASNRLANTINITFEAGMIVSITAIDKHGGLIKLK